MAPSPEALLEAARAARAHAYAPYSSFAVGAAIDAGDGGIICGSNVENASYGLSICAERAAVAAAVSAGYRTLRSIAVAGPDQAPAAPCGACRQVLAEFNPHMVVTYTSPRGTVTTTLAELLPDSFNTLV
jgi:cytidine deaminase